MILESTLIFSRITWLAGARVTAVQVHIGMLMSLISPEFRLATVILTMKVKNATHESGDIEVGGNTL